MWVPATKVVVERSGRVVLEGLGYTGSECLTDLEELLRKLKEKGVEAEVEAQERKAAAPLQRYAARSSSS